MKSYEKTIGNLTVCSASTLSPRFVDIRFNFRNQSISTMTMQEARDLRHMLLEVLELAAQDED